MCGHSLITGKHAVSYTSKRQTRFNYHAILNLFINNTSNLHNFSTFSKPVAQTRHIDCFIRRIGYGCQFSSGTNQSRANL